MAVKQDSTLKGFKTFQDIVKGAKTPGLDRLGLSTLFTGGIAGRAEEQAAQDVKATQKDLEEKTGEKALTGATETAITAPVTGGTAEVTKQGTVISKAGNNMVDVSNWSAPSKVELPEYKTGVNAYNRILENIVQPTVEEATATAQSSVDPYRESLLSDKESNVKAVGELAAAREKTLQGLFEGLGGYVNRDTYNLGETSAVDPSRDAALAILASLAQTPGTSNIDILSLLSPNYFPQYNELESAILGGRGQAIRERAKSTLGEVESAKQGKVKSLEDFIKGKEEATERISKQYETGSEEIGKIRDQMMTDVDSTFNKLQENLSPEKLREQASGAISNIDTKVQEDVSTFINQISPIVGTGYTAYNNYQDAQKAYSDTQNKLDTIINAVREKVKVNPAFTDLLSKLTSLSDQHKSVAYNTVLSKMTPLEKAVAKTQHQGPFAGEELTGEELVLLQNAGKVLKPGQVAAGASSTFGANNPNLPYSSTVKQATLSQKELQDILSGKTKLTGGLKK